MRTRSSYCFAESSFINFRFASLCKLMESMDLEGEDHELVFVDSAKRRRARAKQVVFYLGIAAVCLLVVTVLGLAIALGVVEHGDDKSPTQNPTTQAPTQPPTNNCPTSTCVTESCLKLAQDVGANLDTSVDPCVDFYSFSCGGWVKNNPLPQGRARYSPFNKLDERNKHQLIGILSGDGDDDIKAVATLKKLYALCLNESHLNESGASPLLLAINNFGGWPLVNGSSGSGSSGSGSSDSGSGSLPPLSLNAFLGTKFYGNPAFFSLYVYVDDKNSSEYTIFLEQSGLTLPSPENYGAESEGLLSAFREYAVSILSLLNPEISKGIYETAVDDIIELEKELAGIFVSAVDLRDPEATYNKMDVAQLSLEFPNTFDWTGVFQHSFSFANASSIMTDEEVVVRTTSYFHNLSRVLSQTENDTVFNYVMWQYIKGYIPYLSQDFLKVYYRFTEAVYGSGQRDRNETCLAIVQSAMPIALARPYTEFILPGGTKEAVEDMIYQVKKAFKERVNDSDWLEATTKEKCYEKVDAITQRVAYPELIYHDSYVNGLYENYTLQNDNLLSDMARVTLVVNVENLRKLHTEVDKTKWDIAPTAVNAYYNPYFNQFTFLEGILAAPFIKVDWPDYFKYGAFGVVVGHELTHGFDDQGQQYDKDGNLKTWWGSTSSERFENRQTCFREQYSSYELFGHHVNGNLTLGENLADNGGLKTSFQAYENIAGEQGTQYYLPGLKYTPDQLFFIAFAQVWCSNFTPEYISTSLLTNPHSPGPFRVNGTLVNSQAFADTFQCLQGSPMNPVNKCLMW